MGKWSNFLHNDPMNPGHSRFKDSGRKWIGCCLIILLTNAIDYTQRSALILNFRSKNNVKEIRKG